MNRMIMNDEMLEQVNGGVVATENTADDTITLSDIAKALKRVSSGMKINSAVQKFDDSYTE